MSAPKAPFVIQPDSMRGLISSVVDAQRSGDWEAVDRALHRMVVGDYKNGLNAIRAWLTALSKHAKKEGGEARRAAGWRTWPEILGELIERHGDGQQVVDGKGQRLVFWPRLKGSDCLKLYAHLEHEGEGDEGEFRVHATNASPKPPRDERLIKALAAEGLQLVESLPEADQERALVALNKVAEAGSVKQMRELIGRIQAALESAGPTEDPASDPVEPEAAEEGESEAGDAE